MLLCNARNRVTPLRPYLTLSVLFVVLAQVLQQPNGQIVLAPIGWQQGMSRPM